MTLPSPAAHLSKRGAPIGNSNARVHGVYSRLDPHPLASLTFHIKHLNQLRCSSAAASTELLVAARKIRDEINTVCGPLNDIHDPLFQPATDLFLDIQALIARTLVSVGTPAIAYAQIRKIADDPLAIIRWGFQHRGITRDADTFRPVPANSLPLLAPFFTSSLHPEVGSVESGSASFGSSIPDFAWQGLSSPDPARQGLSSPDPARQGLSSPAELSSSIFDLFFPVFEKSTQNSFLTGEQWALLEPLLPPDPEPVVQKGDPPGFIALNRWKFSDEIPGELALFIANQEYHRLMDRCQPPPEEALPGPSRRKTGRPRTSPRPLLDAIFWKLATGVAWTDLPSGCPPARSCKKYHARLFRSGRLYTIFHALWNDLSIRGGTDPHDLVEQNWFNLDLRGKVVASANGPFTWEMRTSLLFLQLAAALDRAREREKRARRRQEPLDLRLLDIDNFPESPFDRGWESPDHPQARYGK